MIISRHRNDVRRIILFTRRLRYTDVTISVMASQMTECLFECLFNRLFRLISKKNPMTGGFPSQMASNAETVSIPRHRHVAPHWHWPSSIIVTSKWARWRLKSPASRLFTQPLVQAQIKENFKTPRHWTLWGEFTGDRGKYFIWWRHHVRLRLLFDLSWMSSF